VNENLARMTANYNALREAMASPNAKTAVPTAALRIKVPSTEGVESPSTRLFGRPRSP
jgi:hypothetical protein